MQTPTEDPRTLPQGPARDPDRSGDRRSEAVHQKDFSSYNRELRDTVNPETGERVLLLTRKQYVAQLKAELKSIKDF